MWFTQEAKAAGNKCPQCGAGMERFEVRNHSYIWHDGDVYCVDCDIKVGDFDAG